MTLTMMSNFEPEIDVYAYYQQISGQNVYGKQPQPIKRLVK